MNILFSEKHSLTNFSLDTNNRYTRMCIQLVCRDKGTQQNDLFRGIKMQKEGTLMSAFFHLKDPLFKIYQKLQVPPTGC